MSDFIFISIPNLMIYTRTLERIKIIFKIKYNNEVNTCVNNYPLEQMLLFN